MKFETTIKTASGQVQVTVHDGSTCADLTVTGRRDTVTVYLDYRALGLLAAGLCGAGLGAVFHGQTGSPVDVDTEAGVLSLGQPSGITVDDRNGHLVYCPLTAEECSQLSRAFSAARNDL